MQPDSKDKISNIIKESLKNSNFDDQLAEKKPFCAIKKKLEKKFEKEYLTIQLKNLMEIFLRQLILLEWKEVHYIEN